MHKMNLPAVPREQRPLPPAATQPAPPGPCLPPRSQLPGWRDGPLRTLLPRTGFTRSHRLFPFSHFPRVSPLSHLTLELLPPFPEMVSCLTSSVHTRGIYHLQPCCHNFFWHMSGHHLFLHFIFLTEHPTCCDQCC